MKHDQRSKKSFQIGKTKKGIIYTTIKDIRNIFRLEENGEIKDRVLRDIRNVFRLERENKVIKDIILGES